MYKKYMLIFVKKTSSFLPNVSFVKSSLLLLVIMTTVCVMTTHADITLVSTDTTRQFSGVGNTDVGVFVFTINADSDVMHSIDQVTIKNTSSVSFGSGIEKASLYKKLNNDTNINPSSVDTLIDSLSFSPGADSSQVFTFTPIQISSLNSVTLIVAYDIGASYTSLGLTTNIVLTTVRDTGLNTLDTSSISAITTSNTVTLTGIQKMVVKDISPDIILPGQQDVAMLYISLSANLGSDQVETDLSFTIQNSFSNFVTDPLLSNGITKAYLYRELNGNSIFSDPDLEEGIIKIKELTATDFSSSSLLNFQINPSITSFGKLQDTTQVSTYNFFVVYDIGASIPITANTAIAANFNSFYGVGKFSKNKITWPLTQEEILTPIPTSKVAGLSLESIQSIAVLDSTFGPQSTAPLLGFTVQANHTAITLNSINVYNPSSIVFSTDIHSPFNITAVNLYQDNGNGAFSDTVDTLLTRITLGNSNTSRLATIDLSNSPLFLAQDTSTTLFLTYSFGNVITPQSNVSGNTTNQAIARLGAVDGIASITAQSGTRVTASIFIDESAGLTGKAASPEAEVTVLSQANLSIISMQDITPTTSIPIQGQRFVPALYLNLNINSAISSANFEFLSASLSFSNESGFSAIHIYEDSSTLGVFDSNDIFLASATSFGGGGYFKCLWSSIKGWK